MDEDDFRLILKQNSEKFITYDLSPGIYTITDISEAVHLLGDHEGTIKLEYDGNTMKTKLILTRFGSTFGTLRFDERSFLVLYWVSRLIGIARLLMQFMLRAQVYIQVIKF